MDIKVRPARRADADAISRVVLAALRTSNARDYPVRVIERVQLSFSPSAIERLMQQRRMFVAVAGRWLSELPAWRVRLCARCLSTLTGIVGASGVC